MNNVFLEIIKEQHPNIKELQTFNDGWNHAVFVVDQTMAYRFPKNKSNRHQLKIETEFVNYFCTISPIPIPQMQLYSFKNLLYVTYSFIKGRPFNYDIINEMSPDTVKKNANLTGSFLKKLHSIPIQKAKDMNLNSMDLLNFWPKKKYQTISFFKNHLSKELLLWIGNEYDEFITRINKESITLCVNHSDLKQPHIIINDQNKIQGIIDFSEVIIGDPAYDFQYLGRYGNDFFMEVLSTYNNIDSYFMYRQKFYEILSYLEQFEAALLSHDEDIIQKSKNELDLKFMKM